MIDQHTKPTMAEPTQDPAPPVEKRGGRAVAPGQTQTAWAGPVRQRRRISKIGTAAHERATAFDEMVQAANSPVERPPLISPIVLVTARPRDAVTLESLIGACGHSTVTARNLDQAAQDAHAFRWNCVVVDLDSLKDLAGAIDALVNLRAERPNVLVVVLSKEVKRDDFSLERLAMCDVTLRLPVRPEDLHFALEEARVNNQVWVKRCRQMKLLAAAGSVA